MNPGGGTALMEVRHLREPVHIVGVTLYPDEDRGPGLLNVIK